VAESLPQTDGSPSICEVRVSTIPTHELHAGEDQLNLTFIDTPGFGSIVDTLQVIRPVVDYHQQQFARTDRVFTKDVSSSQLLRFLRAPTGPHTHVDVCIYGILHRLTPVDIEFIKRLAPFVNIVPVILKCDTLKPEEVFRLKVFPNAANPFLDANPSGTVKEQDPNLHIWYECRRAR
jgi:septin family protein